LAPFEFVAERGQDAKQREPDVIDFLSQRQVSHAEMVSFECWVPRGGPNSLGSQAVNERE
jgi:hypothetical protein